MSHIPTHIVLFQSQNLLTKFSKQLIGIFNAQQLPCSLIRERTETLVRLPHISKKRIITRTRSAFNELNQPFVPFSRPATSDQTKILKNATEQCSHLIGVILQFLSRVAKFTIEVIPIDLYNRRNLTMHYGGSLSKMAPTLLITCGVTPSDSKAFSNKRSKLVVRITRIYPAFTNRAMA